MSEVLETAQTKAAPSASTTRRKTLITLLVLHHDQRPAADAIAAFTAKGAKTAPHYYIDAAGQITQLVSDDRAARHSGTATWDKRRRNIDRMSIGITLEHRDGAEYAPEQLAALNDLLDQLEKRYGLNDAAIVQWRPGAKGAAGSLTHVLPPLAPTISEAPLPGPMVLGIEDSASNSGLWAFLQAQTYRQLGGDFKYTVNDLTRSQAFPIYATKNDVGAPVAQNASTPVVVNGAAYNYQVFARDTIFNEGRNYSAVQSLNSLLTKHAIPEGGVSRALLEASYATALAASRVPLKGNKDFHDDWRFHFVAMRERLGPALSGNYVTDDGQWAVQVFAGDTLYTPMSDQTGCQLLSEADPANNPEYTLMWTETYKVSGAPYNPNSDFQQLAAKEDIGTPLSGVFSADYGGTSYQVQVFALDTLYKGPDGNLQRLSALPKPPDVLAWQPATAVPPPPTPRPAPPVVASSTPVRDINWPPRPNFNVLQSKIGRASCRETVRN